MESPITAADSLAIHVTVEKYSSNGQGASSSKTIHEEESVVPIKVDDGTDEVRVELPANGVVNAEQIPEIGSGGEKLPEPIRRHIAEETETNNAPR